MSADAIGWMFVGFTIAIYALIGVLSRTMEFNQYYVAGREVPAVYNGMATAADSMSGASFIAMAGGIYLKGYPYMAFLVGWTGGCAGSKSARTISPSSAVIPCLTSSELRYGGNLARLCAVVILVVASFTYVTAQITGTGIVASRALDIPFNVGVWIGLAGILFCSMLGGMRAVTWTQVAQYIVLIIAYLIPVFWMSNKLGYGLILTLHNLMLSVVSNNLNSCIRWDSWHWLRRQRAWLLCLLVSTTQATPSRQSGVFHFSVVYDAWYGFVAPRLDALFYNGISESGTAICGVVPNLHLPALFDGSSSGNIHEAVIT